MRTLLTGELTQALSRDSDFYIKLEVQNASGTWIDLGAALGYHWIVNATWGEHVETKVWQVTFTLVQVIGDASLSPLMSGSVLNVDDLLAYAPLLNVGRLTRAVVATMPHGVPLDVSKYRPFHDGSIEDLEQADAMGTVMSITLVCTDLGGFLQDMQIETSGIEYGTTPVGTALETVLQNVIDANIPAGEPAVTLVKQSASTFLVTAWNQGDTKVMEALSTLVLDSTGEDIRYRYDAAHVSQLMWFNPDRTRVTVDATIPANQYILRRLSLSRRDIRNAGAMPYVGGVARATAPTSIIDFRRRFFRLPSSAMITTLPEAQRVIDAVVNDLSAPPGEAAADCPFLWFVQLYDRYTFEANDRQYDQDQTFAVMGYQHTIENSRGSTTLTLTSRIVGAFGEWLKRINGVSTEPLGELGNVQWSVTAGVTTVTFERNATTAEVWAAADLAALGPSPDWDALSETVTPLPVGATSLVVPTPADGEVTMVQLEPRHLDLTVGIVRRLLITASPQVPHVELDDLETATVGTQWWKITERGIPVASVEVQTQVGQAPVSGFVAPTRGPGDASAVRGGTLAAGEYEHDVLLDDTRQSWIMPNITLSNGAPAITLGPFGFDRNKAPNLGLVTVDGTTVTIIADSADTFSVGLSSKTRTWERRTDGAIATFDVALADLGSNPGLGSGSADTFTATAYSNSVADTDGGTLSDSRDIIVNNGAAPAGATLMLLSASAPVADGDLDITITAQCTANPGGYSLKVYIEDPSGTTAVDRTAGLSPAPSGLPTVPTSYTYTTAHPRRFTAPTVILKVRADVMSGGVVQHTLSTFVAWYTDP